MDNLDLFCALYSIGSDETENFFTTTDRIRVVHHILQTIAFGKRSSAQIGIDRLLEQQIFVAAFPLHDVSALQISQQITKINLILLWTKTKFLMRKHARILSLNT